LSLFPLRGIRRDDLDPGLRVIGYRKRVTIVFKVTDERVLIVGIYYGGRNYDELLHDSG
jgi:toxin ParE1/3/4